MKFVYQKAMADFIKRPSLRLEVKSFMNTMSWVSHDLDLLKPYCRGYRILLSSSWFMMVLVTICSIVTSTIIIMICNYGISWSYLLVCVRVCVCVITQYDLIDCVSVCRSTQGDLQYIRQTYISNLLSHCSTTHLVVFPLLI